MHPYFKTIASEEWSFRSFCNTDIDLDWNKVSSVFQTNLTTISKHDNDAVRRECAGKLLADFIARKKQHSEWVRTQKRRNGKVLLQDEVRSGSSSLLSEDIKDLVDEFKSDTSMILRKRKAVNYKEKEKEDEDEDEAQVKLTAAQNKKTRKKFIEIDDSRPTPPKRIHKESEAVLNANGVVHYKQVVHTLNAKDDGLDDGLDDEVELEDLDDINPFASSDHTTEPFPMTEDHKYPREDSDPNRWHLPSGVSVDVAIRGPCSLPKAHPSRYSVIRIGKNVMQPGWIKVEDWQCLQASVEQPDFVLDGCRMEFFSELLDQDNLDGYKATIDKHRPSGKDDQEMYFYLNVIDFYCKTTFTGFNALDSPHAQESTLGSCLIHPILQFLAMPNGVLYFPGEVYLEASARRRILRRRLKPEDDKPLGLKVDGVFQTAGDVEVGFIELSGGPTTKDQPRYLKDHVRGFIGLRDLLDDIATRFIGADFHIMRSLRLWFWHMHGLNTEVWYMDLPTNGVYRMVLVGTFILPITFANHAQLLEALPVIWQLGKGLQNSVSTLEMLKKSHNRSRVLRNSKVELTNFINQTMLSSPSRPTGKSARTVRPIEKATPFAL